LARTGRDPLSRVVANSVGRWSPAVWKKAFARSSDRMAVLCRAIVAHPQLATAVIEANEAHNGDARPDLVMGMMFNHLVAFRLAQETMAPDAWLLLDEGLCNRVTSLFAADFDPERDRRELVRYLDLIPVPDVLVVVSTPIDLCFVRLESIGWTERIRDKRPEQRRAFLERSALLVELTGEHIGARWWRSTGPRTWRSAPPPPSERCVGRQGCPTLRAASSRADGRAAGRSPNFSGLVLARGTQNLRFAANGRRSFNISGLRVATTPRNLRFFAGAT